MRFPKIKMVGIAVLALSGILLPLYVLNPPGLLKTACEIGLPNLSRPASVDSEALGCNILGPKQAASGILVTGFEASNFKSPDFRPVEGWSDENPDSSWFNCPQAGCGTALNKQLSDKPLAACRRDGRSLRLASIKVVGWATIVAGSGYGHLNQYPREFFAERILEVGPPPQEMVEEWISARRSRGMCDDQK